MRNKIFGSFIVILLVLGICLLNRKEEILVLENRKASTIYNINADKVINNQLEDTVNDILSDQFYCRDNLIRLYYKYKNSANSLFGEADKQIINSDIKRLKNGYLIKNTDDINWDDAYNGALDRGYNLRRVFDTYPYVKMYVYVPTNVVETHLLDDESYTSQFDELEKAFISQTRDDIKFERLKIDTMEDYEKYYYKYDIHWNIEGAYQGYTDIINMINDDFDIGEPKEILGKVTCKLGFLGSDAREVGDIVEGYDYISDYDLGIDDDDYTLFVDGEREYLNKNKEAYLKNKLDVGIDHGDYFSYYGRLGYFKVFDFNDESKPNLLIFADSYIIPIQEMLASHFNKTIIYDLRMREDNDFDLEEIMEEYQIDVILNLEYYYDLYINGHCFIPID